MYLCIIGKNRLLKNFHGNCLDKAFELNTCDKFGEMTYFACFRKDHETLMRYLLICYEIVNDNLLDVSREYEFDIILFRT